MGRLSKQYAGGDKGGGAEVLATAGDFRGGMPMTSPIQIIVDSREQTPFTFAGYPVEVAVGTLASGDYSLHGFENRIAIERKSLADLVGCLSGERDRFERELQRLKAVDAGCVIIESPTADLLAGKFRSRMSPDAAWQSVIAFQMRYRIPFIFCQDRGGAERTCFDYLRHFQKDRQRELRALFCEGGNNGDVPLAGARVYVNGRKT